MNNLKNFNDIHKLLKKDKNLWDLFTKKDEYNLQKTDKYGRASYKTSNYKEILTPIVSEYLIKNGFHVEYEDGKKFAIFLSHDIDDIYFSNRQLFRSFIPLPFHRDKFGLAKFISEYIKKQKNYINFRKIIEIEKRYNATSTFIFLASEKDIFGDKYYLEEIREEISYILDHNCEIGLHTGFYSFDNIEKIKFEKNELEKIAGKKIVGVRNHVFRFYIPQTWKLLAQAGFEYDSSFGYYDMIGFKNGICHPFKPYDLVENKKIDILEITPCIVDITMFFYMNIDADKAWIYIKNLIDTVEKFQGVLTIIWHNWTFNFPISYAGLFGKEWTKLYEKILEYSYKKNAWITNGKNICNYFNKLFFC